jgi:DNA-binding transcriptional regulator YhcF (GntR family)
MTREAVLRQAISFHLRSDSGVPAYLQLAEQVRQALRMGMLEIGDQLPTVKEVVAEVAVNPNTVIRAYRELEHEGLVEGRQGVGTFVARRPDGAPPEVQVRLARSLSRWVVSARAEGLTDEAIEALVRSTLRDPLVVKSA